MYSMSTRPTTCGLDQIPPLNKEKCVFHFGPRILFRHCVQIRHWLMASQARMAQFASFCKMLHGIEVEIRPLWLTMRLKTLYCCHSAWKSAVESIRFAFFLLHCSVGAIKC